MNKVTIYIPKKWSEGACQIRSSINDYNDAVDCKLEVALAGQIDPHKIVIDENSLLRPQEISFIQNAVERINSEIIHSGFDIWKSKLLVDENLSKNLKEIDSGLELGSLDGE